ncbi:MAG: FG-GAP repeat protein [Proteobacteria bacterium]|nr:FG-GAP repeat protein [Pseudomonadota bacterium]
MRTSLLLALVLPSVLTACGSGPTPDQAACEASDAAAGGFVGVLGVQDATAQLDGPGESLVPLGDVNDDGVPDLAVVRGERSITVVDGATWNGIRTITGDAIYAVGDVDDDGRQDAVVFNAIGNLFGLHGGASASSDMEFDSADEEPIRAVAGGQDFDGDGVDDLLFSRLLPGSRDKEVVSLASSAKIAEVLEAEGQSGSVDVTELEEVVGAVVDGDGPASLAMLGDFDGDGLSELATGGTRNFAGVHTADRIGQGFFGGSVDQEVHLHDCHPDGCDSGVEVASVGDLDGDGLADLLLRTFPDPEVWIVGGNQLAEEAFGAQLSGGVRPTSRQLLGATAAKAGLTGASTCEGELLVTLESEQVVLVPYTHLVGDAVTLPTDAHADLALDPEEQTISALLDFPGLVDVAAVGDVDGDGLDDLAVLTTDGLFLLGSAGAPE